MPTKQNLTSARKLAREDMKLYKINLNPFEKGTLSYAEYERFNPYKAPVYRPKHSQRPH